MFLILLSGCKQLEAVKMAKIYVSAGHGGKQQGVIVNGYMEKIIQFKLQMYCQNYCVHTAIQSYRIE